MIKYIRGFFIILFTLLLATGGLFLPVFLINKQQEALFAKTETIHLPTAEDTNHTAFIQFTPDQLLPIAVCYGDRINWNVYDAVNEDLTTEYLIQTTHEQIDQLCQLGILPEIFSGANYTWENIERGTAWTDEITEFFPVSPIAKQDFSGWIAYCRNSNVTINVRINASSGQILYLFASWTKEEGTQSSPNSTSEILAQYLDYLGLSDVSCGIWNTDDNHYYCSFEKDYPVLLAVWQNHRDFEENPETEDMGGEFFYALTISFMN